MAQKVLLGKTKGYKNHPQLIRFMDTINPVGAIATYLRHVADEADKRAFRFDRGKITNKSLRGKLPVTNGQLDYEFAHLLSKLKERSPDLFRQFKENMKIEPHPMFKKVSGDREGWEKAGSK